MQIGPDLAPFDLDEALVVEHAKQGLEEEGDEDDDADEGVSGGLRSVELKL